MKTKEQVLKEYFGHDKFRYGQGEIIDNLISGRDCLCIMPTGAGKSVCYQVTAMLFDGVTIVISPLISLMKDQVQALKAMGIRGAFINSSLNTEQYFKVLENMKKGMYKIIYVAPERLETAAFQDAVSKIKISLVAVDEAHCISHWGQDFRPGYLKICDFIKSIGKRPVVGAFTATATEEVKDDIKRILEMEQPFEITTGFNRENIFFSVENPDNKLKRLLQLLKERRSGVGIVYCSTRRNVEEVTEALLEHGYNAARYHAGLPDEERIKNQEDFIYDRVQIMVATNAFGMGIDKSNVRFVIHYNMPKNIESYYQEAGRGGRDGERSDAVLLYAPLDVRTNRFLIEQSNMNELLTDEEKADILERDYERLKQMTFYSTTKTCLRHFILGYFGEKSPAYCGDCANCLAHFEEIDITREAQIIISCIVRTNHRFGKKMICDTLRGSKNEKVVRLGLNEQSTYALLKDLSDKRVRQIIDFLIDEGYLASEEGEYPRLLTTGKCREIIGGDTILRMKVEKEAIVKLTKKSDEGVDEGLLAELKKVRREFAERDHIPAYIIFSDAALLDMCRKRPSTDEEFLDVLGVGRVKLERYGSSFLRTIREYKND